MLIIACRTASSISDSGSSLLKLKAVTSGTGPPLIHQVLRFAKWIVGMTVSRRDRCRRLQLSP